MSYDTDQLTAAKDSFRVLVKAGCCTEARASHLRVAVIGRHRLCREALSSNLERIVLVELLSASVPDEETVRSLSLDALILDVRLQEEVMRARRLVSRLPGLALVLFGAESGAPSPTDTGGTLGSIECSVEEDGSGAELATAIQLVLQGAKAADLQDRRSPIRLPSSLGSPSIRHEQPELEALTAREHVVLQLASEGLANKEIARSLRISEATVKNHMHNILEKMGARRRGEAAAFFRRHHATRAALRHDPAVRHGPSVA